LRLPAEPALDILFQPLSARLFVLGGAVFGLLMLPWLANPFGDRAIVFVLAYLAFVAANVVLAFMWHLRFRTMVAVLVFLTAIALYATSQMSTSGCEVAPSLHWMINSVGSCLGLLLFASSGKAWNWLILPTMTVMGLWLMFSLPAQCQTVIVMPLIATFTYLAAAIYLISVLLRASDEQRALATSMWTEATAKRAEVAKQLETTAQWNRVSTGTRALLIEIANGELDPRTPEVRQRAAREEGQLRANLGIRRNSDSAIWQDMLTLVERLTSAGFHVDVDAIEFPESDQHLPQVALEILNDVVVTSEDHPVSIRLFVDQGTPEVVCTCQQSVAEQVWMAHFGQMPMASTVRHAVIDHSTEITLEYMEEGLACLSVRQDEK
jgi:hypothetical protein